jgi:eukaryotic-like serine/threonine-protein kinase
MTPERWRQIKAIFNEAVECTPASRAELIRHHCGDQELQKEVESLLASDQETGSLLDSPLSLVAAGRSYAAGTRLGPYEILASIGAGGMGEVYRARDTRLGREVAVKVLPAALAQDPDRLARFEREGKVLASLNHPHIAQLYGVEGEALIMELVEGDAPQGPLPIETALNYARQIVDALEAAHEKGIVHRDLKPANVKITAEGVVKVLDFGLAAVPPGPAGSSHPANSPTPTTGTAQKGMIMGTAAYMSPEQAVGKPADKRADIWSFGVVLWELLTGHRLFEGETVADTLAGVLRGPINLDKLPRETPTAIRDLLRRCLDRNVKNRLRDIGEARVAIDTALAGETPPIEGAAEPGGVRWRWLGWIVASLTTVGLAMVSVLHFREKPPAQTVRFQIPAPENTRLGPYFSLSPDGRKLAFETGGRLWVHFLESGESRDLTTAWGSPFWSPDSRFIGYPAEGKLKTIEATGGPPQTVTDVSGIWGGGAWNRDGVIIFGDQRVGLFRVPSSGGVPVPITALDAARLEQAQGFPSFVPDGRHFFYYRHSADPEKDAIYLGSVDQKPEQQSSKPLVASHWGPVYAPSMDPGTGYLLFMREGTLMAQPFNNRRLELKEQAAPVTEQVGDASDGAGGWGAFSASTNDVLVFWRSGASNRRLTWYDREGKVLETIGEPSNYQALALSPDGMRVAVSMKNGTAANIWLLDLSRGTSTRLTFGSAKDTDPVWSPDGSRIIFSSNRDGSNNLYEKVVSGVKNEEVLLRSSEAKYATSWSRQGRFLLYEATNAKTQEDIWVLPLEGDRKPVPFLITEFREGDAHFSPDGNWVAYDSDESGRDEVYVRSFSMNSAGTSVGVGGEWQISNGGFFPRWSGDGRELYYRSNPGGTIMEVEIATNPVFRPGKPQALGPLSITQGSSGFVWDCTADGRRFLAPAAAKTGPVPYTVVLNWQAGLKR